MDAAWCADDDVLALVPGIDLANHAFHGTPQCNTVRTFDGAQMCFEIHAARALPAGHELCFDYSAQAPMPTYQLFVTYGFVVRDNPNDEILVDFRDEFRECFQAAEGLEPEADAAADQEVRERQAAALRRGDEDELGGARLVGYIKEQLAGLLQQLGESAGRRYALGETAVEELQQSIRDTVEGMLERDEGARVFGTPARLGRQSLLDALLSHADSKAAFARHLNEKQLQESETKLQESEAKLQELRAEVQTMGHSVEFLKAVSAQPAPAPPAAGAASAPASGSTKRCSFSTLFL